MKIGIDVLGGDFAPDANLEGTILARKELSAGETIVLLGDQDAILSGLSALNEDPSHYHIVHAPDMITMEDHPTRAIPQKPNSSIAVGFDMLSKGDINAFASTGNTGAMLVGAIYKINAIPGVIRPCITSILPCEDGSQSIILEPLTISLTKVLIQQLSIPTVKQRFTWHVRVHLATQHKTTTIA